MNLLLRISMFVLGIGIVSLLPSCTSGYKPTPLPQIDAPLDPKEQARLGVLNTFLYGIKENDVDALEPVVAKEVWSKVEQWVKEHEPVMCRPDLLNEEISSGVGHISEEDRWVTSWDLTFGCAGENPRRAVYSLYLDRLEMQFTEQGWKVTNWQKIEEIWK